MYICTIYCLRSNELLHFRIINLYHYFVLGFNKHMFCTVLDLNKTLFLNLLIPNKPAESIVKTNDLFLILF